MTSNEYVSRYLRKENYESLNYPTPPAFSPNRVPHSPHELLSEHKRSVQHQQVEELEQKTELILAHNETLVVENS